MIALSTVAYSKESNMLKKSVKNISSIKPLISDITKTPSNCNDFNERKENFIRNLLSKDDPTLCDCTFRIGPIITQMTFSEDKSGKMYCSGVLGNYKLQTSFTLLNNNGHTSQITIYHLNGNKKYPQILRNNYSYYDSLSLEGGNNFVHFECNIPYNRNYNNSMYEDGYDSIPAKDKKIIPNTSSIPYKISF